MSQPIGQARVSVVVSSYNYRDYVAGAISSALAQTEPSTEVIVIDDGSTDGSPDAIAAFTCLAPIVVKDNGGQASAWNRGFELSSGQLVIFLDSDDLLLPNAAATALEAAAESGVAKVQWPLQVVDRQGAATGRLLRRDLSHGDLRAKVVANGPYGYTWPPSSGNAWSRSFLERVMPMPEEPYRTCPDLYLSALAPFYGTVERVGEPQAQWRAHGANAGAGEPIGERLRDGVRRDRYTLDVLLRHCRELGLEDHREAWERSAFWIQMERAVDEIREVVPVGCGVLLVDEDQWGLHELEGRQTSTFPARDGVYLGPPPDAQCAVSELERMRAEAFEFIAFPAITRWWLEHYDDLARHLDGEYRVAGRSEAVVVYDLRT